MRKFLIFAASCLVLLSTLFGQSVSQSYAAILGDRCSSDEDFRGNFDEFCNQLGEGCLTLRQGRCDPGLYCDGPEMANGLHQDGSHCQQKRTLPQARKLTCTCLSSGTGTVGQNGYRCTDDATGQPVNVLPNLTQNPDKSIAYCGADQRCFTRPGAPYSPQIGGVPHPYGIPADYEMKGISCTREEQAVCRCENPNLAGSGKNRIWCLPPGDPDEGQMATRTGGQKAREVGTYCDGDTLACNPNPGVANSYGIADDPFYSGNVFDPGPHAGAILAGVRCGQPEVNCTCSGTPNVKGSGVNSIRCEMPGQQPAEGWCQHERACVPDGRVNENEVDRLQDNLLNDGKTPTNEDPYDDVDLIGVHCDDAKKYEPPPLPPVPPPPCAEGKLVNMAVCTAFNTAFGEIQTNPGDFLTAVFGILLAGSGGLAVLLIMRAGYILMTSTGKPERVQNGRDQLVAAIVGLLFMIFSFVILQVIGVEILKLPDFTEEVTPGPGNNPAAPAPDHCNSCQSAASCTARGGTSIGVLDCRRGQICCE